MSTFRGIVAEFPQIRIDYFRQQPEHKAPLACFLSHVHSDHLAGLESLRAPFVYCSAATKEILLRLEKYHYRINFAKGILESRNVTYDKSMRKLAKALPLDTPTVLELAPKSSIRVTLIDANHCIGAVMFLIEGNGNAILYTGDIRAETWWVNSLVQNPILVPYTLGPRRLDCIYLDTTFATRKEPYREFPSKAEGIRELLSKVSEYADDTIFYFHSWTFGYESVWIALSSFLGSRIHLDEYRAGLYGSLSTLDRRQLRDAGLAVPTDNKSLRASGLEIREATALCGFRHGNHIQPGCLTSEEQVRIHSCERGMGCEVIDRDTRAKVVHIIPIVTRTNGIEIAELGAGGGKGDLDLQKELETCGVADVGKLMELCAVSIDDQQSLEKVFAMLQHTLGKDGKLCLDKQLQKHGEHVQNELSLQSLTSVLSSHATRDRELEQPQNRTIRFPYSRHSSYSELRELVRAFNPVDVYPCTVDTDRWTPEVSMRSLFGDLCSRDVFRHDVEMKRLLDIELAKSREKRARPQTQKEIQSTDPEMINPIPPKRARSGKTPDTRASMASLESNTFVALKATRNATRDALVNNGKSHISDILPTSTDPITAVPEPSGLPVGRNLAPSDPKGGTTSSDSRSPSIKTITAASRVSTNSSCIGVRNSHKGPRRPKLTNRQLAYQAAIGNYGLSWSEYGGLVSTRSKADQEEQVL